MKIHLDLDCFFVSAERTRHEILKNKPVVVVKGSDRDIFSKEKKKQRFIGKSGAFNSVLEFESDYELKDITNAWKRLYLEPNGKIRGIVIAKSYEAKSFGIKTGTPLSQAFKMCPNLIALPSDHLFYQLLSQKLRLHLLKKIPLLEQYSIDEFFGDLQGYIEDDKTYEFIKELQEDVLKKFDLPLSIGVSRSKWIAKLATSKAKPYGVKVVDDVKAFTKNIPVAEFPGIGRSLQQKLAKSYIKTLGELQVSSCILNSYGKVGQDLIKKINGLDDDKVETQSKRKGIGIGRNFTAIGDRDEIRRRASILTRYLSFSILKLELNPTTFHFTLKYDRGLKSSCSITIDRLFNEKFFHELTREYIDKLDTYKHLKVHYIGINVSNFINQNRHKTVSLLEFNEDRKHLILSKNINCIREKYGVDILKYANEI